jgi:hypothetical protein
LETSICRICSEINLPHVQSYHKLKWKKRIWVSFKNDKFEISAGKENGRVI